jgi:hypothetical protein
MILSWFVSALLGNLLQLFLWLATFLCSLVGLFCSIYLIIMHDDLSQRMIQPMELSDCIQRYCPIEYAASIFMCLTAIAADDAPLLLRACGVPLMLYNMARYRAQDHKMYFISKQEYKHFSRMERQYQVKTVYYTIVFVASLVMAILSAIYFFDLN